MKKLLQTIGTETAAFFTSPIVLKNLGLMLAALIGLFFLTSILLNTCTRQGDSRQVGDFIGRDLRDVMSEAKEKDLRIVVLDSIDRGERSPNEVVEQNPKPFSRVKKHRTIYLTTTRFTRVPTETPPISEMDNFDNYQRALTTRGLKAVIKEERANNRFLPGTILEVYHEDKKLTFDEIDDGYKLGKGSTLEFIVTKYGVDYVKMPDIECNSFDIAEIAIKNARLVVGIIHDDVTVVDRQTAYVYKTIPSYNPDQNLQVGQQIDIYLTQDLPVNCE
ncbi:MAG: PASTA domain-containing protein [Bacteroidota bacterium]